MRPALALGALLGVAACAGAGPTSGGVLPPFGPPANRVPAALVWTRPLVSYEYAPDNAEEFASAEVRPDGKVLWVGTSRGILWSLRVRSGRPLWKRDLGAAILSRPLYVASRRTLFVGGGDGCLWALYPDTGATKWRYCTGGAILRQPTYARGLVLFANERNRVFAVDAVRGKWKWSYDRPMPSKFTIRGHSPVVVHDRRAYVGFADGRIVCLEVGTGQVLWTRDLRAGATEYVDVDGTPVIENGVLYVTSQSGGVYALDPAMGAKLWQYRVQAPTGVTVWGDRIYFVSALEGLHCLDLDGHLVYRRALGKVGAPTRPVVAEDLLVFTTSRKGLLFAERDTGRPVARVDRGFGASAPVTLFRRWLFLLENGGNFMAMLLY